MFKNIYKLKIKHDNGLFNMIVTVLNFDNETIEQLEQRAIDITCNAEHCPISAIKSIKLTKVVEIK